jgi:hypothetical protein
MSYPLLVETTPSRHLQTHLPELHVDYRRVVAVGSPVGRVACAFAGGSPVATEQWSTTEAFGGHVQAFLARWLALRDPEVNRNLTTVEAQYQCHMFALAARGNVLGGPNLAKLEVTAAMQRGRVIRDLDEPLPFGTHVVLRDMDGRGALHSSIAVGIGPNGEPNTADPTDQLQVFDYGSNAGVTPLRESVLYHHQFGLDVEVLALPPPGPIARLGALLCNT